MADVDLAGERVLIREDLNVPVRNGNVSSDARIRAALPTIREAQAAGAAVMLMSHLGRPTEGEPEDEFSLQPVADLLTSMLGVDVELQKDWGNYPYRLVIDVVPVSRASFLAARGAPIVSDPPLDPAASAVTAPPQPKTDARRTIVIDPGHGGIDPG